MKQKPNFKIIKDAMASIEKQFGKGSIMCLGEQPAVKPMEVISTGCMGIDLALGVGGFPRGRMIEVFGPESSGKTTLALHAIAEAHRAGGVCAFIDAEHALDIGYAQKLGVDPEKLLISQPDSGEQALEICETLIRTGAIDMLVVDSVAALVPRAEIEGDMGDSHMGLQARLMSQAMRKLTAVIHKTGCILIFINQLRQKIGVVFGNPEVTTGGNALKFYASVRVEVRRVGAIKDNNDVIGNRTRIKIVKNKVAPPFKQVEVDMIYGRGIWAAGDLIDRAIDYEVLQRAGSWISLQGKQVGHGRDKVAKLVESDPAFAAKLREGIAAKLAGPTVSEGTAAKPAGPAANEGPPAKKANAA